MDGMISPASPVVLESRALFCSNIATNDQKHLFRRAEAFICDPAQRRLVVKGAAGTGKTHCTRAIVSGAVRAGLHCVAVAPTNKAVRVLKNQAAHAPIAAGVFRSATTVKRFVDTVRPSHFQSILGEQEASIGPVGTLVNRTRFIPVAGADGRGKQPDLVVVDESSMLASDQAEKLEESGAKILFVGDGYQLPPVLQADWFGQQPADCVLSEVMRQAKRSGIALLGAAIRQRGGDALRDIAGYGDDIVVVPPGDRDAVVAAAGGWIDVILAHRNSTCNAINLQVVQTRFPGWQPGDAPPVGSRLFAHETLYSKAHGNIIEKAETYIVMEVMALLTGQFAGWVLRLRDSDGLEVVAPCLGASLLDSEYRKGAQAAGVIAHGCADLGFGYCITVHKSQGSEWPCVLVIDDFAGPRSTNAYQRWIYTAVTRASKTLCYSGGR